MRFTVGLVSLLFVMLGEPAFCQISSEDALIKNYQASLSKTLAQLKNSAAPLYMSSYKIGDIWDPSMIHLLESSEHCFKHFEIRTESDTIPSISFKQEAAVGFFFSFKSLFDSSAKANDSAIVTVAFDEVVQEIVTEGDLRRAYDREACPILRATINGDEVETGKEIPVIIGRLYRGKRKITITYSDAASAKAKVSDLAGKLSGAAVQIEGSGALERSLVATDQNTIPIAFAPAFVPMRRSGISQGGSEEGAPTYAWTPYDPNDFPSHRVALQDLADTINQNWSWNK
jgi:hypothetical protein